MTEIINSKKLEELLIANWTSFINYSKLMAHILEIVRDTELAVMEQSTIPKIGIQISISRFELIHNGFLIWVEFKVPKEENKIAIGTSELKLSYSGGLSHIKTIGNLYVINS